MLSTVSLILLETEGHDSGPPCISWEKLQPTVYGQEPQKPTHRYDAAKSAIVALKGLLSFDHDKISGDKTIKFRAKNHDCGSGLHDLGRLDRLPNLQLGRQLPTHYSM